MTGTAPRLVTVTAPALSTQRAARLRPLKELAPTVTRPSLLIPYALPAPRGAGLAPLIQRTALVPARPAMIEPSALIAAAYPSAAPASGRSWRPWATVQRQGDWTVLGPQPKPTVMLPSALTALALDWVQSASMASGWKPSKALQRNAWNELPGAESPTMIWPASFIALAAPRSGAATLSRPSAVQRTACWPLRGYWA